MYGIICSGVLPVTDGNTPPPVRRVIITVLSPAAKPRSTLNGCQPACASASSFRSEEHTSELQSLMRISYAVFCLKKKKQIDIIIISPFWYTTSEYHKYTINDTVRHSKSYYGSIIT